MPPESPSPFVKLAIAAFVLCLGLFLALYLFRNKPPDPSRRFEYMLGDRPWRRLGAAIAVVLAIMFVVGIYVVDIPDRPVPYAVFWLIMLGMIVWLCSLAVKDVLHTRRTYHRWRRELEEEQTGSAENRG